MTCSGVTPITAPRGVAVGFYYSSRDNSLATVMGRPCSPAFTHLPERRAKEECLHMTWSHVCKHVELTVIMLDMHDLTTDS